MTWRSFSFLLSAFYPASLGILATTIFALSALKAEQQFIASIIFALPFVFAIFVPPVVARLTKDIRGNTRVGLQKFCRTALILTAFFTYYGAVVNQIVGLYAYIALLGVLCVDQVITSDAPIIAKKSFGTSVSVSIAYGNILGRGLQSIAPLVAAFLLSTKFQTLTAMLIALTAIVGLYYPLVLRQYLQNQVQEHGSRSRNTLLAGANSVRWGRWYLCFNVLVNLAQGAVGFILLASDPDGYGPIYLSILSSAFLVVQIAIVVGWIDLASFRPAPSAVAMFVALNSVGLFSFVWLVHPWALGLVTLLIGLSYGLSIPLLSEAILERLKGPHFRQHLANAKSAGRLASVSALWIAGLLLSTGITAANLVAVCGVLLAFSSAIMLLSANKLQAIEMSSI